MTIEEISVEEAQQRLDAFDVLDVRSPGEFDGPLGRLEGARLLPLPELATRASELNWGCPLLVVCRSGRRSAHACEWFAEHGLGPAINLAGGMIAWNQAGLPITRARYADAGALLEALIDWYRQARGETADEAHATLDALLRAAGASAAAPTPNSLEQAIAALAERLRRDEAPIDLEIALAAFRSAVAGL